MVDRRQCLCVILHRVSLFYSHYRANFRQPIPPCPAAPLAEQSVPHPNAIHRSADRAQIARFERLSVFNPRTRAASTRDVRSKRVPSSRGLVGGLSASTSSSPVYHTSGCGTARCRLRSAAALNNHTLPLCNATETRCTVRPLNTCTWPRARAVPRAAAAGQEFLPTS